MSRRWPVRLGYSRRCGAGEVDYWRHLGTGPRSFRLGRRVLYRADDLQDWITAQHDNDGPNLA